MRQITAGKLYKRSNGKKYMFVTKVNGGSVEYYFLDMPHSIWQENIYNIYLWEEV